MHMYLQMEKEKLRGWQGGLANASKTFDFSVRALKSYCGVKVGSWQKKKSAINNKKNKGQKERKQIQPPRNSGRRKEKERKTTINANYRGKKNQQNANSISPRNVFLVPTWCELSSIKRGSGVEEFLSPRATGVTRCLLFGSPHKRKPVKGVKKIKNRSKQKVELMSLYFISRRAPYILEAARRS